MGGINPPCTSADTMEAMQKVTLALCCINERFWQGHSDIERAVLIEADLSDEADIYIERAKAGFATAAHASGEAQSACMRALTCLKNHKEGEGDLHKYLKRQLPRLTAVGGSMEALAQQMVPEVLRLNQSGTIQAGMLFEREQSSIRLESLSLVGSLTEMMADHGSMVAATNAIVDMAA